MVPRNALREGPSLLTNLACPNSDRLSRALPCLILHRRLSRRCAELNVVLANVIVDFAMAIGWELSCINC